MKTKVALQLYTVVAPRDVAAPVVAAAARDGNPIDMTDAKVPGWVVMRMKLRPLNPYGGDNLSLIVTKAEPGQLYVTDGSQGEYLRCIRARMHSWLQGDGNHDVAAARLGEYLNAEKGCTTSRHKWGLPRSPGKVAPRAAARQAAPGVRGPDKGPRERRHDLYIVYTAPHGEEIHIRASSSLGRGMMEHGAPEPEGWNHRLDVMKSPLDKRSLLRKIMAVETRGDKEEIVQAKMKMVVTGKLQPSGRVPERKPAK